MIWQKDSFYLKHEKDFKLLVIRALISSINGCAVALFQMYLPLPIYYTLAASTVIFTFVLNYLIYHTPLTANQVKSIIVATLGIILVINGRYIYTLIDGSYVFSSEFDYSSKDLGVILFVSLCVVLWNIIWAYGIVITGKHHSTINELLLINALVGLFFFGILEIFLPVNGSSELNTLLTRKPDIIWKTILFTGVPLAIANYLFNAGLFLSPNTGVSTMISQINILYVYIISTFRYH
jgi:drug/metabolite transporter (DMT)-like permease